MIQFILNNKVIETDANPGMTLLDFIREDQQLKGTKIGCREGDCGACTVLAGTLKNNCLSYQNITSCISPLGNANGKHIVTIEGTNLLKGLNTVQNIMHENYATQCGFCSPGFVVSLTGYALDTKAQSENNCVDAVSGNICRCTGYKSIEKAVQSIDENLAGIDGNHTIKWLIKKGFIPDYFAEIPQKIKNLKISTLDKKGIIVANGTDLYVNQADKLTEAKVHLIANDISLKGINFLNKTCALGSNTTVTDLFENERLKNIFPRLKEFLKLVSSQQIRNMGTLGGNFVNASPIGDMSIFFLALNSTLTIKHNNGTSRQIPFHMFHTDYKVYDLEKDELISSVSFQIPDKDTYFNFEKVSKRTYLDIASVNSACRIKIKDNTIIDAHFSIGGTAPIPKYLKKTNQYLIGKDVSPENIKQAANTLQSEICPIDDVRGTSAYKRLLARQLFYSHFIELFPEKFDFKNLLT